MAEQGASHPRIGHGFDVHAFEPGDHIILGGVQIPHSSALRAHSDGDVLLHALSDALLGAIGLGDIGQHYPDTDERFEDADSRVLLRDVVSKLVERHYRVANVDLTVIAQQPKLAPWVSAMRENIAADLAVETSAVNIKATTTERLGYLGRGEGIAAHAVALLISEGFDLT